jgi:hypothetical protein
MRLYWVELVFSELNPASYHDSEGDFHENSTKALVLNGAVLRTDAGRPVAIGFGRSVRLANRDIRRDLDGVGRAGLPGQHGLDDVANVAPLQHACHSPTAIADIEKKDR